MNKKEKNLIRKLDLVLSTYGLLLLGIPSLWLVNIYWEIRKDKITIEIMQTMISQVEHFRQKHHRYPSSDAELKTTLAGQIPKPVRENEISFYLDHDDTNRYFIKTSLPDSTILRYDSKEPKNGIQRISF